MGFDAGTVVEPLDWDFTKYDGGKGTVPEPTDKMIETFFRDIAKAAAEMFTTLGIDKDEAAAADPVTVIETVAATDIETPLTTKMFDAMFKATAKLCSNQPSLAQLKKLPMRVRSRFVTWLIGELSPEVGGAVSLSPGAAPGLNGMRALPPGFTRTG